MKTATVIDLVFQPKKMEAILGLVYKYIECFSHEFQKSVFWPLIVSEPA